MGRQSTAIPLIPHYSDQYKYEICIDECARGTLIYSTCIGAVVLDRDITKFNHRQSDETNTTALPVSTSDIKDSKKFSSKKRLKEVAEHILNSNGVIAHHIATIEASEIDRINILQAVFKGMHECIYAILEQLRIIEELHGRTLNPFEDVLILVDGDKFNPYCIYDATTETMREIPSMTIEQGDAKYMGIASAAIIAKNHHDGLIWTLCREYPELDARYNLSKNVGYATKDHLDGIRQYGITQFHRRTFGICKTSPLSPVSLQT